MNRQMKRAYATTVAAAAAVALTAGMTGPTSAGGSTAAGGTGKAGKAGQTTKAGSSAAAQGPVAHRVTLITGDRVAVDAKGRVLGVERAAGREHIAIRTRDASRREHAHPVAGSLLPGAHQLDATAFDQPSMQQSQRPRGQHARSHDECLLHRIPLSTPPWVLMHRSTR
ncbi:hypothetical protein ACWIID_11270 [Streptomyces phaeochromogenes]